MHGKYQKFSKKLFDIGVFYIDFVSNASFSFIILVYVIVVVIDTFCSQRLILVYLKYSNKIRFE